MTDCTYAATYNGCNGGYVADAWYHLYSAGGQMSSSTYPFTSGSTGISATCKFNLNQVSARLINSGYRVPSDEASIQQALVTYGPLSHYFYVSNNFYYYR